MDTIAHHLQQLILDAGYAGLFFLIVLESTAVPIPSLLVMPFAGYLAAQGHFSLPVILVVNSAAALTGSLLSYWFGAAGGKRLLLRYGKWILVKPDDLDKAHGYFERHGVEYHIKPELRSMVQYRHLNLAAIRGVVRFPEGLLVRLGRPLAHAHDVHQVPRNLHPLRLRKLAML